MKCHTCNLSYIRQTDRDLKTRYKGHKRYITTNLRSAHAKHIFDNQHKYDPTDTTMGLLKTCSKGNIMNCSENLFIQKTAKGQIILEQTSYEHNI
jgi:hypothetical protein